MARLGFPAEIIVTIVTVTFFATSAQIKLLFKVQMVTVNARLKNSRTEIPVKTVKIKTVRAVLMRQLAINVKKGQFLD